MNIRTFLKGLALAIGLAMIPLTVSSDHKVALAEAACAVDGTCCKELGSICGLNGSTYYNYYYKSYGSCKD